MRKIISGIDIDGESIKLVVGEFFENRLHILSASKVPCVGIEAGKIVDEEAVVTSIKAAVYEVSNTLGVKFDKCILGLNMLNARLCKSASAVKITTEPAIITGKSVDEVISKCADGRVPLDYVLASVVPVEFTVDGDSVVKKPVGVESTNLGLKGIVISSPRKYVSEMLDIVNRAGLKVLDVVPNSLGDYYAHRTQEMDSQNGAVVNLGYDSTTVSIFNKGIITNSNTFPLGVRNIIKDISFVAKIGDREAHAVYRDIVLANSKLSNPNEYRIVTDLEGEEIQLNQYDVSEVAASRIEEILNLVKKQINVLTKKEISYIIIVGGLTELRDFNLALERVFGKDATLGKLNLLGARDNSYSSAVGIIQYYEARMELKDRAFSIFSPNELESMATSSKEPNINNNSLLSKVFGYFFDN